MPVDEKDFERVELVETAFPDGFRGALQERDVVHLLGPWRPVKEEED